MEENFRSELCISKVDACGDATEMEEAKFREAINDTWIQVFHTVYSQEISNLGLIDECRQSVMVQQPERSHMKRLSEEFDEPELQARDVNGFVKL